MKCWNCGHQVPENAKSCVKCEADLTEIPPVTALDEKAAMEMLKGLPDDVREEIQNLMSSSETAEDFINAIFVGDCPKCDSDNVGDCEDDPDYENILLGRCFDCGAVWCTDCSYVLKKGEKDCPNAKEHELEFPDLDD